MVNCPLARIGREGACECWGEQCKWWVKTVGGGGDCFTLTIMLMLHSYLFMKMSTESPPPDLGSPSSLKDLAEKYRIDLEDFRMR